MKPDDNDLHRSGLAFGWLEETRPRSTARRYWTAVASVLAGVVTAIAVIAWRFR
jgi:hypothetical protein